MAASKETTSIYRCGIPGCWERKNPKKELCDPHLKAGWLDKLHEYRRQLDAKVSIFEAFHNTGLNKAVSDRSV